MSVGIVYAKLVPAAERILVNPPLLYDASTSYVIAFPSASVDVP
ncbi:hypothetical protein [Heyndrickxia oleronia]|nr:hypothetical protein [Heyndrickxia oleronia]